ncbi:hypothetical protein L228DRAFT_197434, partial [Xylona heveae TC161]
KRKAEEDLSQSVYAKRHRDRVRTMTTMEREIEKAKNNDRHARNRAIRKLKTTKEYIEANEEKRAELEKVTTSNVMHRR